MKGWPRVEGRTALVALALIACASAARADDPARRSPPDPLAALTGAARSADPGELRRLAPRLPPAPLAACIAESPRPRRLACLEASAFTRPSPVVLTALAGALFARDRAVAVAAGAALEGLTGPDATSIQELAAGDVAPAIDAMSRAASDRHLGPDVRAAALHALARLPRATLDATGLLSDPDPLIRREAVATLAGRPAHAAAIAKLAAEDHDDSVAAAAAAAACEQGHVPRAVDARVLGWLSAPVLGPASLAPLLACARGHGDATGRAWIAAARQSPRPDVRALVP